MTADPGRAFEDAPATATTRGLSTARSVLRVLSLLIERPDGVRADEVAEVLGKSVSTAYYLLVSLCEEGFAVHETKGVYRPARGVDELAAVAVGDARAHAGLDATVDALFERTRRRSYLGVVRAGRIEIVAFRGRQGVPCMPGLGDEIHEFHALAMGKIVLSRLGPEAVARYADGGMRRFTEATITSPAELDAELAQVREQGYAVDRAEFDESFSCVAAAIEDGHGHFTAVLGLSVSTAVFDADRDELAVAVRAVAAEASERLAAGAALRARPRPDRRMACVR